VDINYEGYLGRNAFTPPKTNMLPEKGRFKKDMSSSNHQFSGNILVFRGVCTVSWVFPPSCRSFFGGSQLFDDFSAWIDIFS